MRAAAIVLLLVGCAAAPPRVASTKQATAHTPAALYRRLGPIAADCALTSFVPPGCTRVLPISSHSGDMSAVGSADDDTCTVWNSGAFPPHELVMELPPETPIAGLLLATEQTPDGTTTQIVETSDDGAAWTELAALHGHTITQTVYGARTARRTARFVRIRTTESPSWVAFRDVAMLSCTGTMRLAGAAVPRRSPVVHAGTWTRGTGACTSARDCVPNDCCFPTRCIARDGAPRCRQLGCPDVIAPTVECGCRSGTCGGWVSGPGLDSGEGL